MRFTKEGRWRLRQRPEILRSVLMPLIPALMPLMPARLRYDFGGSRFQKLMWGAIPLNPTAQMSVMVRHGDESILPARSFDGTVESGG